MEEKEFLRLFVAIEIDERLRTELRKVHAELARTAAHARWVPPGNLHLSLAFLGDTPCERLDPIKQALDSACADSVQFKFSVAGLGTFGKPRRPRVVWAGVEQAPELMRLQADIAVALESLRFQPDQRKYTPHITLGRMKSAHGSENVLQVLADNRDRTFGDIALDRVVLMRSVLEPDGARHHPVHSAILTPS